MGSGFHPGQEVLAVGALKLCSAVPSLVMPGVGAQIIDLPLRLSGHLSICRERAFPCTPPRS